MLLSICLFCLVYCASHRQRAANVLPLGLFGPNLCRALCRAPRRTTLLVIRVIHSTCWWPPLHPLHRTRSPFHLALTALRCESMIVLKMDNAWNMDIIKIMHLCSAHTVSCARKVKGRTNFRPAHGLKRNLPIGFAYMGHKEALNVSSY